MKLLGFTETHRFTRRLVNLLPDEEYANLQNDLCNEPEAGAIIKGSNGIRKVRFSFGGRGKRGGARIIYYWAVSREKIIMLDIYAKNEKENLAQTELKKLSDFVEEFTKNEKRGF